MKIDKTQINGSQFMFTIACFFYASGLLTSFLSVITSNESWLILIISSLISLPLFLIFKWIIVKFPNKNLFQIFEHVYGKVFGKILSIIFIIFFILLVSLNISDLTSFSKTTVLNKTPDYVIISICVLVAAFAVKHGIKVVARYSFMFAIFAYIFLFFSFIMLINQLDLLNYLPLFNVEKIRYIQGIHISLTIPIGEFVVLLMLTPNVVMERKKVSKFLYGGLMLGFLGLTIIKLRDIGVLGELFTLISLPPLASLRLVDLGEALSRMEIFFAIVIILLLFFKITIMLYAIVIGFCQIFEVKNYKKLILVVAGLVIAFSMTTVRIDPVTKVGFGKETTPFVWGFLEYFVPLVTLLIAIISKKTEDHEKQKKADFLRKKNLRALRLKSIEKSKKRGSI